MTESSNGILDNIKKPFWRIVGGIALIAGAIFLAHELEICSNVIDVRGGFVDVLGQ